jgi:DNA invertase Pin-like site-specific DNA recombinase
MPSGWRGAAVTVATPAVGLSRRLASLDGVDRGPGGVRERTFAIHIFLAVSVLVAPVTHAVYAAMSRARVFAIQSGHADRLRPGEHPRSAPRSAARRRALRAAGCDEVFIDKASGKLARLPELDRALLSANRAGDQLVITKLDRLGRSLEHLIELSRLLQARGVDLVVLDQGIDTSTAVGRMFFQILGAIAEFEHALMSERTMDGLAAARARGRTGGQKPKLGPRQVKLAREMYEETDEDGKRRYTVARIAAEFGVARPTIYRHLARAAG